MPGQPSWEHREQPTAGLSQAHGLDPERQGGRKLPQKALGQAEREGPGEGNHLCAVLAASPSWRDTELPGQDSTQQVPGLSRTDNTPRWDSQARESTRPSLGNSRACCPPSSLTARDPHAAGGREGGGNPHGARPSSGHRAGDPKARESPPGTIPTREKDQGPPQGAKVLPIPQGTSLSGE